MQQRAGLAPLIASKGVALCAPAPRNPVALEHLPDRRSVPAGQRRQAHRTPVRAGPGIEDLLLVFGVQRVRAAARHRPPRMQTREVLPRPPRRPVASAATPCERRSANTPTPSRSREMTRQPDDVRPSRSAQPIRTDIYGLACPVSSQEPEVGRTSQPPTETGHLSPSRSIQTKDQCTKSVARTTRRNAVERVGSAGDDGRTVIVGGEFVGKPGRGELRNAPAVGLLGTVGPGWSSR
jgi:hypothetical protein